MTHTMVAQTLDNDDLPELPMPNERECPFVPPPEYARLRAEAPVSKVVCPTGINAWLVTRHADARQVLGDPRRFSNRPGQVAHVLAHMDPEMAVGEGDFSRMDGPDHLRFRRFLAPELTSGKRIAELRPFVQGIVDDQLDILATRTPPVDFYRDFARPVTSSVIAEMIGVPEADRPIFRHGAEAVFNLDGEGGDDVAEALQPLFAYLYSLVVSRREQPADDVLSSMIVRSDETDRPFTDVEMVLMSSALLLAGFDTTAAVMSYGFLALFENPDELARLRDNPEFGATAAEEFVRYFAIGAGVLRQVTQDTTIGEQSVAAGDYVVVALQSANHDTQMYPDAARLDVGRKASPHVGFGHGPHQCVGQQLARLELTTVLATVLARIPSLRLAVPLEQVEFKVDELVRGPSVLPVTWDAVLPRPSAGETADPAADAATGAAVG